MTQGQELVIEHLAAGYGKVQVLWDVSLHARPGEFVAVIGANGAGKTTTLRAVSGVVKPTGGHIRLGGQDITRSAPSQIVGLGLGHVPEGRELFPLMTVRENLELGAAMRAEARATQAQTLDHVYTLFPRLRERQGQLAGTLSGGEQQMVAVGRALMGRPSVLVVDEPSLGLSPLMTQTVFGALKAVNAEGVTVLLVEQNVGLSLKLADRAYVLENGQVVNEGTGAALLADPRVREAYLAL
ncbi:ABC transporter ATP-binding protein [Deinococcus metallilatus]|uniref:ABC transporter ATP-binding protein n=1 Tax=Deinococcus metallilatus TaxID=1211322 RepID=A0AAJ5F1H8_9DEIO|nr:ABC transporter ATP-binding protein [Deinococcus metallilatus]MBB5296762.1 branched-chain amino acid transport system ATP-binding protein [Deinococcus metallilatus]QBY09166.1 ABC transporter ATP-binding protein [Deinococcus metallilatus]RXJ09681.1 ABC transporter ATP-binding protein [Deinococcus metallilatus]TLK24147.1 ABC transporter ATP-binding protein [Deinococcus metallilatus]GMA13793.1 ABC transporter ATP-binding protein [Deinococcus metallilatus]